MAGAGARIIWAAAGSASTTAWLGDSTLSIHLNHFLPSWSPDVMKHQLQTFKTSVYLELTEALILLIGLQGHAEEIEEPRCQMAIGRPLRGPQSWTRLV
jgi:hypothetical protein